MYTQKTNFSKNIVIVSNTLLSIIKKARMIIKNYKVKPQVTY